MSNEPRFDVVCNVYHRMQNVSCQIKPKHHSGVHAPTWIRHDARAWPLPDKQVTLQTNIIKHLHNTNSDCHLTRKTFARVLNATTVCDIQEMLVYLIAKAPN